MKMDGLFDSKVKVPAAITKAAKEIPGLKIELNRFNNSLDTLTGYAPYILAVGAVVVGIAVLSRVASGIKKTPVIPAGGTK